MNEKVFTSGRFGTYWMAQVKLKLQIAVQLVLVPKNEFGLKGLY